VLATATREHGPILNGKRDGPPDFPSVGRVAAGIDDLLGGGAERVAARRWEIATGQSRSSFLSESSSIAWGDANIHGTKRSPVAVRSCGSEAQRREADRDRPCGRAQRRRGTGICGSTREAIWRWRSGLLHVIIGETEKFMTPITSPKSPAGFEDLAADARGLRAGAHRGAHRGSRKDDIIQAGPDYCDGCAGGDSLKYGCAAEARAGGNAVSRVDRAAGVGGSWKDVGGG